MLENRVVRYIVYGTSAVLISEVLYHAYRLVRLVWVSRSSSPSSSSFASSCADEVAEVIWTNELTQTCVGRHRGFSASSAAVDVSLLPADSMEQDGHIVKLPTPTATPLCQNLYCAANNVGRLIALIDESRYTIDLAMYTFTSYELCQALSRALRRGVVVRIISDKEMVYSSGSQIITLTKAGVPVRCPSTTMLMHHKFCILDGLQRATSVLSQTAKKYNAKSVRGVLMSGSLNWTMQGFGGNWENILISSNKTLVRKFEDEYERMWKAFEEKVEIPKFKSSFTSK